MEDQDFLSSSGEDGQAAGAGEQGGGQAQGSGEQGGDQSGQEGKVDLNAIMAENAKLKGRVETLDADNQRFMKFHEEVQPHLGLLNKLKGAFGSDGAGDGRPTIPDPPPDILARMSSRDPNVQKAAARDYVMFYGRTGAEDFHKEQEALRQQESEKAQKKRERQAASFALLESERSSYRELAKWARPHLEALRYQASINPQIQQDWGWIDSVPEDLYGATLLQQLVGAAVCRSGPEKLKNFLTLITAVEAANRGALDSAAGTGGVNPGLDSKGQMTEADKIKETVADVLGQSQL